MVNRPIQVALFAASPVPYQAPLYRRIAADPRFDFTAIFASAAGVRPASLGFSQPVAWDVDVLSGYRSIFLSQANRAEIESPSFLRHRDFDVVTTLIRGDFEVLWSHGYKSLTHALAIATQLARRRPLLIREEQTLLHPRPALKSAVRSIALGAIMSRAYALYIGTENRRWFQSFNVPEVRQFPAPYCVDNDRLQAESKRLKPLRDEVKRAFGIQRDSGPVILTVARLIPKKQPLFLLEAFRRLRKHMRCCLLLVGSGQLEAEIRHEIRERQIPDVILAGFLNQSEVARAYVAADIFTLPSKMHETWGLVVNEAMNFGLPIIVSNKVGCAPDLVQEGRNGFVVSAEDPSELAKRLETLVGSPELRAQFGTASLELVSSLTYDAAAEGILRAVEAAVGPKRWAAAIAPSSDERKLVSRRLG